MGALQDRLQADLTAAMRARDELVTGTLRMALTAVKAESVSGTAAHELSEDEVLRVLVREGKKRREAADAFEQANRPELAARERAEGAVLDAYLPIQISDEELGELVTAAVAEAGASGLGQLGLVMKVLTPRVAGRAEGGRVAAAVKARLSGS